MKSTWELVGRPQWPAIEYVVSQAQQSLTLVTPFVSRKAVARLLRLLTSQPEVKIQFLTAADPNAMVSGACDPTALRMIAERCLDESIHRLQGLHAKVYIADGDIALLTSANLTGGGGWLNYEYGVSIADPDTVRGVLQDISGYLSIATPLTRASLAEVEEIVAAGTTISGPSDRVSDPTVSAIEDILVREHVTGKSEHEVFVNSVLFVLDREGPLSTAEIHPHIEALHPQLCDGRERIIDGRSFGKRWKHQVRNSQQYLKDKGLIELSGGVWRLIDRE